MKTCIITIIKNEHEYLKEWIDYHLALGIDHIFIFEDTDSDSHKAITDSYPQDKVTLSSILSVLDPDKAKEAEEVKRTQIYNVQHIYLRNAVSYIKRKNLYDWCFLIDNDEFITLENDNNINDVLKLYEAYDAVLLRWKCYGADSHIEKPDYTGKGLVGTYTKEIENKVDHPRYHNKTCYKLSSFDASFIKQSHHYPDDRCNYCNTSFSKTLLEPTYKNMYIRHYITKSWEEFVWKKKKRGFMFERPRNLESFFILNKDLASKKEELLDNIRNEILVVLTYSQSGSQGNEIRLALTGWKKFCTFKYKFVVIGDFDNRLRKEFKWVTFIECEKHPKKDGQYNPHLDMINKMKAVTDKYNYIYDGFIWMNDDFYPVKPFSLDDVKSLHYHTPSFTGQKDKPTSYWTNNKWKTRQLLDKEELPHVNYTTHYPMWLEFSKLSYMIKRFNMDKESYVIEDIYYNFYNHKEAILDSSIRLGIWDNNIYKNEFDKAVSNPNIKFMCNSVEGWSKELEDSLHKIIFE